MSDVFELVSVEETSQHKFRSSRYKAARLAPVQSDPFELATPAELDEHFGMLAMLVQNRKGRRSERFGQTPMPIRPICFIDGEGCNVGTPIIHFKNKLKSSTQAQNYALLSAGYQNGLYDPLIGENNCERIPTEKCLQFLTSIPKENVCIGFGFNYDVEQILYDLPVKHMQILRKSKWVRWSHWLINWIPNKYFYVRRITRKKKQKSPNDPSIRIYDIRGFWNTSFVNVTQKWNVATPEEMTFLIMMKDHRADFGPITDTTLEYNKLEGKLAVRVFEKIREEWTKLGLRISSPHGAGAVASAMYEANHLEDYMQLQECIPPAVVLRAFYGGRFDITRQGQFGIAYESDINSAYPYQMGFLPCLTHSTITHTTRYVEDKRTLWLVRWHDTNQRWALFPYRDSNHINYYSSGIGWYYGDEVEAARELDPTIEILEGYRFIQNCNHVPFKFIKEYYERRQELKKSAPFTAELLKIGMNAGYGKLSQTKGFKARWQNMIWAGMITSGTRAMLLRAIAHDPESVIALSTDSVVSLKPLPLDYDETRLGAWKMKTLPDLLQLENGFSYSSDGQKDTHRGFSASEWKWTELIEQWKSTGEIIVDHLEFNGVYESWVQHKPELRCTWTTQQVRKRFEVSERRQVENSWIYPGFNPIPWKLSDEMDQRKAIIDMSQFGVDLVDSL